MRFVQGAALAAMSSFALFSSTAYAADSCWYPNEAKAAQLRDFHTMLMVGALQCRVANPQSIVRYNEFVTKQRGALDANATVLKTHFLREDGIQQGQSAYDRFATARANGHSAKAAAPEFCGNVDSFMRMATSASQGDLLILAQSLSPAPASGACPPSNFAASEPAAPAPAGVAVAAAPISEAAATASAPEPAAGVTVAAKEEAVVTPAVATEKTAVAAPALADKAPAPTPVSREDALQAAIVALQSAATALQAASASGVPAAANVAAPAANPVQTIAAVKVEDAPIVPPKEATIP